MYQKWLEAFHYVASESSFTRAATRLNVGQPTISTHVKSLERHFRVKLFQRNSRLVELTPEGRELFAITSDMFRHRQQAINYLTKLKNLESGELNFGAVRPYDVMELIVALKSKRPRIRCSVQLRSSEDIVDDLDTFRADIGIVSRPIPDSSIYSMFYRHHRVFVVVNKAHRLANKSNVRLSDLDGEDMIVRSSSSTTQDAFDRAVAKAGLKITSAIEVNSREGVREAVIRNMGIGVVSETVFVPHPKIHPIIIDDAEVLTDAYVICLGSRKNRPLIRDCLQTARGLIGQLALR